MGANREGFRRTTGVMRCKRSDPDVNEIRALVLSQQPLRRRGPIFERGCAIFPDAERDGASAPPEGWGGSISISNAGRWSRLQIACDFLPRQRQSVTCAAKIFWEIFPGSVTHHRHLDRSRAG